MTMKAMAASQFKAQCLAVLDSIGPEGLVITKRGKPVARLIPMRGAPGDLLGSLRGKVEIRGDLLCTGVRWNADA
jgi:antitoxin (DNA-binding transcriptional repressor) of toxin-antitoxin stability system